MKITARSVINILGWCACAVVLAIGAALLTGFIVYSKYEERAAKFDLTTIGAVPQRSTVFDANGELYSHLHGENRFVVPLDRVSKHFINALLAREDARFWEHDGVDLRGVARAAVVNWREGATRQGASTITQQLARNCFALTAKNLDRKALEAVIARRIEGAYSKAQILELYVNRIYFGSGFHGIEAAARGYFGKPAAELTLSESALLAGLIRSPNRFSPARDLEGSIAERNVVLDRMVELQMLTPADAAEARASQVAVTRQKSLRFQDDYVMDAVSRELEALLSPDVIDFGGLRIFTTVDPQLQQLAQTAADRRLAAIEAGKNYPHPKKADFTPAAEGEEEKPTDYLQAAVVAIDNRTGAIRALVGGRDHQHSKYSRALLSKRQIGSTFKPFIYAAAFQRGLLPGTLIDDSKINPGEFRSISDKWSPENSDGEYAGPQPAAWGLLKSRNTMTVRIGEYVGLPAVREVGMSAGIAETMPDLPVAFLGAFETTLKALTASYTVFPNLGVLRAPHLISRVETSDGQIVYKAGQPDRRVLTEEAAWMTSSIMQQIMKTGTASKAESIGWKKPGAGKTGTTNDFFDAWFVGYTSSLTCGVWVGMDKPQTILEKGYGSALALPIWVDFMQQVPEKTYAAQPFAPPVPLVTVQICSVSGTRATSSCVQMKTAYQTGLPVTRVPGATCPTHPEPTQPMLYTSQPVPPSAPAAAGTQPVVLGSAPATPAVGSSAQPPVATAASAVAAASSTLRISSPPQPADRLPQSNAGLSPATVATLPPTLGPQIVSSPTAPAANAAALPAGAPGSRAAPAELPADRVQPIRVSPHDPNAGGTQIARPGARERVRVMRAIPVEQGRRRAPQDDNDDDDEDEAEEREPRARRVLRGEVVRTPARERRVIAAEVED